MNDSNNPPESVRAPNPETVARILKDPDCRAPDPQTLEPSAAEMAEGMRLAALRRARRTIVLEIDSLMADNEGERAHKLQAALDAIDHFVTMLILHSRAFQ